jgi:hypothetical protein
MINRNAPSPQDITQLPLSTRTSDFILSGRTDSFFLFFLFRDSSPSMGDVDHKWLYIMSRRET